MAIILRNLRGSNLSLMLGLPGTKRKCYTIGPNGLDLSKVGIASTLADAQQMLASSPDGAVYLKKNIVVLEDTEAVPTVNIEAEVAAMLAKSAANVVAADERAKAEAELKALVDADTERLLRAGMVVEGDHPLAPPPETTATLLDELSVLGQEIEASAPAPAVVEAAPVVEAPPAPEAPTPVAPEAPSKLGLTAAQIAAGPSMDWPEAALLSLAKDKGIDTAGLSMAGVVRKLKQSK